MSKYVRQRIELFITCLLSTLLCVAPVKVYLLLLK